MEIEDRQFVESSSYPCESHACGASSFANKGRGTDTQGQKDRESSSSCSSSSNVSNSSNGYS